MSAVTKSWAPTKGNPVAAAQRKKIILLVALGVMLVALLAFEVPRIMHRGSPEPASTPDTSTGLVTDQIGTAGDTADAANATTAATTASADSAAQAGTTATPAATSPVATAPKASKAILAIRHRPAKDPFVPLLGETTTAPTGTSTTGASTTGASTTGASTQVSTPAATSTPKHESTPVTVGTTPGLSTTPSLATSPAVPSTPTATKTSSGTKTHGTSKHTRHAAAPKVVPTVAVVNTGGKKQAVAVGEYFKAGNLWFQLVALHPKSMELAVVGGGFTGGKQTITVGLNDPVTLYNTATGVEYPLVLTRAATGITTTSQPAPGGAAAANGTAPATPAAQSTTTTTTTTDPAASATTTS